MSTLLLLAPAIAWGILPLVVSATGGRPVNEIFGTALGTLIVAVIVDLFLRPTIDTKSFILALVAGAFWIVGQLGQYTGYDAIGVAQTMPISTGLQLVGTSLVGVVIFGEWSTVTAKLIGALGILILIVGVILTSIRDKKDTLSNKGNRGTIIMLVFTTIGFITYNAIPKALSDSGIAIFLPESIGMVLAVLVYLLFTRQGAAFRESASWRNIIGGVVFSVASLTYILSVRENGVNTAFIISQLSVVISTLGGLLILKEKKSRRELFATLGGLILIVGGAVITTFI
ncbi:GRP family sugar transporter [Secundilactobacillus paracollinoides]|uniref:GRP family sugar transporter n=1 Tax=Secundilactobacillus paracollinoides TaxID=240427 RepID=UPI0006EFE534|nr:GRP family sugar transporter [Secundilactobacillus paracollinoides]KRL79285.1 glucose uptake protein [Secundilactobacillus paracollinoides DSM 15502 = JCM 11969]